jgi:integrase
MHVGRRRTKHKNLPPRLHLKRGRFYYGRNQEFVGDNLADALRVWAEKEAAKAGKRPVLFKDLADDYLRLEIPKKALRTQDDYIADRMALLSVFGPAPLAQIQPTHIRGYLDNRMDKRTGKLAKTRANREVAVFSAIWNWGRDTGRTTLQNPCVGVKRHKEAGRDRYVEDAEFVAVWEKACQPVKDAMELYLLTGQRVSDVLKMTLRDAEQMISVRQGKTGHKLRIVQEGPLGALLEQIRSRTYPAERVISTALVRDEKGQPLTYDALFNRFEKARGAAGVHFQLRDLRAKAGTDLGDLALAQKLLGHASRTMTEHYIKRRLGDVVRPLLRTPAGIADKK